MSGIQKTWVDEFNLAAVDYLIKNNLVWTNGVSSKGKIQAHMDTCSIVRIHYVTQEIEEITIQERDHSLSHPTVSLIIAAFTCGCNKYTDQRLAFEGTFVDIIAGAAK